MKNRKNRKRKLNNKGLTLIEILIAMTLLTIAIVPMMRGFIQVNKYGEKGRNLQQSTSIAQTAMENCKAYNVADIHNKMSNGEFLDSSASYMGTAQYLSDEVGVYFIDNIMLDSRKVGMEIRLNPIMATKQEITKYENCNERLDGIFVASQTTFDDGSNDIPFHNMETKRFDELLQWIADSIETKVYQETGETVVIEVAEMRENLFDPLTASVNLGKLEFFREITISAETDGSGNDVAKVTYKYSAHGAGAYIYTLPDGTTVSYDMSSTTYSVPDTDAIIYTNANSKSQDGRLERIYFYYYPAYNNGLYTQNPCKWDEINIVTNSFKDDTGAAKDLDVYLIKQKLPGTSDILIELAEQEPTYNNFVNVKAAGTVNLYHNFKVNIGNESDLTWPALNELNVITGNCQDKEGLVETEEKELMYTIQVKMYSNPTVATNPSTGKYQMTGEEILTLDGTKINW